MWEGWGVWELLEVWEVQDSKNIGLQIFSDDKELALRLRGGHKLNFSNLKPLFYSNFSLFFHFISYQLFVTFFK